MNDHKQSYTDSDKYYYAIYNDQSRNDYEKTFNDFLFLAKSFDFKLTNVLDYGCGTGTLSIMFARQGINVTGIDLSEEQIAIAKEKVKTLVLLSKVTFQVRYMVDFITSEQFDAAGSFFSPFCYLLTNQEVISFLENAYSMIRPVGILYFEFWNSYAVKPDLQSYLVAKDKDITINRFNRSYFDMKTGILKNPMNHLIIKDKQVISEFTETHKLRTYTIPQLTTLIAQTRWNLVDIYSNYYNLPPNEKEPKIENFRLYVVLKK